MTRLADILIPALGILLAVIYLAFTYDLPRESRIFPHTAVVVVIVFGLILVAQAIGGSAMLERGDPPADGGRSKAPMVYGLALAFVAGFWTVGFLAASSIFLFVAQLLLGQPRLRSAVIALGVTACFYGMFDTLLGVRL